MFAVVSLWQVRNPDVVNHPHPSRAGEIREALLHTINLDVPPNRRLPHKGCAASLHTVRFCGFYGIYLIQTRARRTI